MKWSPFWYREICAIRRQLPILAANILNPCSFRCVFPTLTPSDSYLSRLGANLVIGIPSVQTTGKLLAVSLALSWGVRFWCDHVRINVHWPQHCNVCNFSWNYGACLWPSSYTCLVKYLGLKPSMFPEKPLNPSEELFCIFSGNAAQILQQTKKMVSPSLEHFFSSHGNAVSN